MAYLNSSDVGNFLQQTLSTAQQSELDTIIIPGMCAFADDYMNRTYTIDNNTLQTETFDGNQDTFFPHLVPIDTTKVVTVTDNGTVLTLGLDFFVYPSYIELVTPASDYEEGVVITYYTKANNCPLISSLLSSNGQRKSLKSQTMPGDKQPVGTKVQSV